METNTNFKYRKAISNGLVAGLISVLIALVGMVETFGRDDVVQGFLTVGELILFAPVIMLMVTNLRSTPNTSKWTLLAMTAIIAVMAGIVITLLILLGQAVNLRPIFVNASPNLFSLIMRRTEPPLGLLMPTLQSLVIALLMFGIFLTPPRFRSAITSGFLWVVVLGTLRDQLLLIDALKTPAVSSFVKRVIFAPSGLRPLGALIIFLIPAVFSFFVGSKRLVGTIQSATRKNRTLVIPLLLIAAAIVLSLPYVLGIFFTEILDTTGYFIMMGLGLNIVVGFAGLLDLGYVAFYAIGAYTMGVLTSPGLGLFHLTFWQAFPIALLVAWLAGIILGLPVLRMRGDYLAIVTLGFGEIVRLLALSDWLKGTLGGTQGIQGIAQPVIAGFPFNNLQRLYYLILIGIIVLAFISWRLKDSHLGRSWMAIREDEDVAQAMGINLVLTKLLAFSTGALFAGIAGTLGAAKLTSVYPHSMTFIVSINVLVMIIIGGMGSIPGVFVGGLVLVGLPGLLTEFAEYRLWFYGLALVAMMLFRPEGLWPEARRKLELHEVEVDGEPIPVEVAGVGQQE